MSPMTGPSTDPTPVPRLSGASVAQVGEFELISALTHDLPQGAAVSVGPGDDGAVFLVNGSAVVSTDLLVETVHFRTDWSGPEQIGRKAIAVNVADLEAMGAQPVCVVIALGLPADTPAEWVRSLYAGVRTECEAAGVSLVGGDTTGAEQLTIGVTVIGQTGHLPPVTRDGAVPGQVVAYTGRLGWASAGLSVLQRGFRSPRAAVAAQQVPQVPYGQGRRAAQAGATAMVDVSDGLLADLGHLASGSGVRIELDSSLVPVDEPLHVVGAATGVDPMGFALTGGEDHALAATFDEQLVPQGWTVIGSVVAGEPAVLVDGQPWAGAQGWEHFTG